MTTFCLMTSGPPFIFQIKKKFGHSGLLCSFLKVLFFIWQIFEEFISSHDDSWPKILLLTVFEGYCCSTELMVYGLVPFVPFFIDLHLLSSEKLCWLIKNVVKMGHPLSFEKCLECHPFSFY